MSRFLARSSNASTDNAEGKICAATGLRTLINVRRIQGFSDEAVWPALSHGIMHYCRSSVHPDLARGDQLWIGL